MKRAAVALIAIVWALASCGGEATSPSISALAVSPEAGVRAGENLTVTVEYVDDDEDLGAGSAELALRRQDEPRGQLYTVQLSGEETARGRLVLTVKLPVGLPPGGYEVGVTLVDGAGRRSNSLTGAFEVLE